jgi:CheY-like chemotaxis protein
MPTAKTRVLVVDDDDLLRTSLLEMLTESDYSVRFAEEGFAALLQIRQEIPDVIISDLNMPAMSGVEFLSVVRRRFPDIRVIAMSGAFSGDGVPPGIAADDFYAKGSNLNALMKMVKVISSPERFCRLRRHPFELTPIWIPRNGYDPSGQAYIMVTCPECLRIFPQVFVEGINPIYETCCVYCCSLILYAIVQPTDPTTAQASYRKAGACIALPLKGLDLG